MSNTITTIRTLHRWIGFIAAPVVFVIAITGCLYAFKEEIRDITIPSRFYHDVGQAFLAPSQLIAQAQQALPEKKVHAVMYHYTNRSAKVLFFEHEQENQYYLTAYIHPQTGEVMDIVDEETGFFHFILDGHFYLWLPEEIGQPTVAIATLVFFVLILLGFWLWWPKSKGAQKQRFKLKWNASWRRLNFDLHAVMGFYITWIAILFIITGLVWGFEWFQSAYYTTISGKEFQTYSLPHSSDAKGTAAIDQAWAKMQSYYPNAEWIEVHPPEQEGDYIAANANPDEDTYWQTDYRYFHPITLEEAQVDHIWGRTANSNNGDYLMRMNYDIHVGAIAGLTGKIIAFLSSLIIASLPITGILMWWGRHKKSRNV